MISLTLCISWYPRFVVVQSRLDGDVSYLNMAIEKACYTMGCRFLPLKISAARENFKGRISSRKFTNTKDYLVRHSKSRQSDILLTNTGNSLGELDVGGGFCSEWPHFEDSVLKAAHTALVKRPMYMGKWFYYSVIMQRSFQFPLFSWMWGVSVWVVCICSVLWRGALSLIIF